MQEHHEVSPAPPAPTPSHNHHAGGGGGGGGDGDGGGGGADGSHFFEGTEKLLEIWFSGDSESGDLRQIPRHRLDELMKTIRCLIVSESHTEQHDAYILSESSLFVSSRRVILKTCGSTLLLRALSPLLQLAKTHAALTHIEEIFYSRKNFLKPSSQQFPHRSFQEEAAFLERILPGGASYCMGPMNKDCWYLYTLDRSLPASRHLRAPDQTLEVLMSDLDPAVMSLFFQRTGVTARHVTQMSGIADLIPGSIIDDVLFDPCGYSMNGLTDNGVYWTIHVTPEAGFSYVSFETNVALDCYDDLVAHVTRVFQPGRFITTLFFNETSPCRMSAGSSPTVAGFELLTRQLAQFSHNHYSLHYCSFTRAANNNTNNNNTNNNNTTAAAAVEAAATVVATTAAAAAAATVEAAATTAAAATVEVAAVVASSSSATTAAATTAAATTAAATTAAATTAAATTAAATAAAAATVETAAATTVAAAAATVEAAATAAASSAAAAVATAATTAAAATVEAAAATVASSSATTAVAAAATVATTTTAVATTTPVAATTTTDGVVNNPSTRAGGGNNFDKANNNNDETTTNNNHHHHQLQLQPSLTQQG